MIEVIDDPGRKGRRVECWTYAESSTEIPAQRMAYSMVCFIGGARANCNFAAPKKSQDHFLSPWYLPPPIRNWAQPND